MYKKLIPFFVFFLIGSSAFADGIDLKNPFFGDYKHQIAVNLGTGIDSGVIISPPFRLVPFAVVHFQYSIPSTFFGLPARQSINIAQTVGFGEKYGWHWDKYTIPIIFLSQDFAFFHGKDWYLGSGIGVGMQGQQNERLGSKLLFQFKIFAGYELTENINGEVFFLHMSNGNTAPQNNSYAFYGFGLVYKF